MGIYITQQKKEELEAKIKAIRTNDRDEYESDEDYLLRKHELEQSFIDEILSQVITLPVEESWAIVGHKSTGSAIQEKYKNGVIIKPK